MNDPTLARLFSYSDWANATVAESASVLSDAQLDVPLDIGPQPGSLRRILRHIVVAETVWLNRWQGKVETPWMNETGVRMTVGEVAASFERLSVDREMFFDELDERRLVEIKNYRDSKGTLFMATLRDMLLQGIVHSAHHRAQAVNAIRRVGGQAPEIDLMHHVRIPVGDGE